MKEKLYNESINKKEAGEIATLKIIRKNGELYLYCRVNKEIENFFKNAQIRESSCYQKPNKKLNFYGLIEGDNSYSNIEYKENVILRSYGSELKRNGVSNFSFLRSVGISKKSGIHFKIDGLISTEALEAYVTDFKQFMKRLYKEYLSDVVITITFTLREL